MKWRKKNKPVEVEKEELEKTFTSLQQDAIMASMICLDEAFMIARKKKDVTSLIDIADKWYGISQTIDDVEDKKRPIGFSTIAEEDNE